MRANDKILLENVDDYFDHKGLSPNVIDDVKDKLVKDFQKSEDAQMDYIEYRQKSPAEIILIIQKNLFSIQLNPTIFFIVNYILISYLYDKLLVPLGAATLLSVIYFVAVLPMTLFIYTRIIHKNYLYRNRFEMIFGMVIAVIMFVMTIMHTLNFDLGVITVSVYAHQFVFICSCAMALYGLYVKRLELTGVGLLLLQKTIDVVVMNTFVAQVISIIIWILILLVIIYYTIRLSTRYKQK